jgi:N-acylneuraminate cytidylyltransferase
MKINKNIVCLIPARGGSKRIPRKNIKKFCGQPMISWPIQAAISSGVFSRVIVTTDDLEIANVSKSYGGEVPFIRSADLSNDMVGLTEVIRDTIHWLEQNNTFPDFVCCVYATAAFLQSNDLVNAFEELEYNQSADFIMSVCSFQSSPFQGLTLSKNKFLKYIWDENAEKRTQDLPPAYFEAGLFWIGKTKCFKNYSNAFCGKVLPYVIPHIRCHDIDTLEDWIYAEDIFNFLSNRKV